MRILVVDEDQRSADFIARALRSEGFYCVSTRSGNEALTLAEDGDFDLILLELVIKDLNGMEVCQRLRMRKDLTPLIMLTSLDSVDDMVAGLRMGADDYITKPFAIENLLARVSAVLRRSTPKNEIQDSVSYQDIEFDSRSMRVSVGGKSIAFSAKELAILELFVNHPEKLFSRERILSNVWGLDKGLHWKAAQETR